VFQELVIPDLYFISPDNAILDVIKLFGRQYLGMWSKTVFQVCMSHSIVCFMQIEIMVSTSEVTHCAQGAVV
jgi:hypothetical protein